METRVTHWPSIAHRALYPLSSYFCPVAYHNPESASVSVRGYDCTISVRMCA